MCVCVVSVLIKIKVLCVVSVLIKIKVLCVVSVLIKIKVLCVCVDVWMPAGGGRSCDSHVIVM